MRLKALQEAKKLLTQSKMGVLSTLSYAMPGYPFGSTVQFTYDRCNHTVQFFISDIAQHTKNLDHNEKLSLTVFEPHEQTDPELSRLTILGSAKRLRRDESNLLLENYTTQFPSAKQYVDLQDFHIWQMTIKRARYISGFGKIFWLEEPDWHADNDHL